MSSLCATCLNVAELPSPTTGSFSPVFGIARVIRSLASKACKSPDGRAQAAVRHQFSGRIICGHCCSLSVQTEAAVLETVEAVKAANISVVSLPMCNLYLQDRRQGRTPRYRGVTILRELEAAGVQCAIASDNCRDPFFAYGDHDGLEVFTQSARIGHLDHPIGDTKYAKQIISKMMHRIFSRLKTGIEGVKGGE